MSHPKTFKVMLFVVVVVLVIGVFYAYAQTQAVALSVEGETVTTAPLHGYDGVVRIGRAQHIVTASGNVVITINGIRIMTDTAVWQWGSTQIELAGGVRVELPSTPSSIYIGRHR